MGAYVVRRLIQAVFTVMGVMVLTFLLFNLVAGDIASQYVSRKQGEQAKMDWKKKYGLDKPAIVNREAGVRVWTGEFYDTQFWKHMSDCVTFRGYSYRYEQTRLIDIIKARAKYSLALTVPAMALGWLFALVISSIVAYYRGTWIDRVGVFVTVLGMCVPYLAYMILGQWLMFKVSPKHAWGLIDPINIYVPVTIAVVASIGGSVRFYRTIFLDEMNRDYVRTARAKGVPLPSVLFKHVLRNCMLPVLTSLVMSIPFLIMGSLLLESFFGINGLGDLLISSINDRDVPIITGLTFLTAVIYVIAMLITDVLYAVFDPRIRLK